MDQTSQIRSLKLDTFSPSVSTQAELASYFLAQNCGRRGCGWNRNVCGKLQGRTDLQLTPMAAYESFL
jgi:hypothetical protein